jgi:hypothetical protein
MTSQIPRATASGEVAGTIHCLPLEHLRGKELAAGSGLCSPGPELYEALSAKLPQ